jgi:hypothetical protein
MRHLPSTETFQQRSVKLFPEMNSQLLKQLRNFLAGSLLWRGSLCIKAAKNFLRVKGQHLWQFAAPITRSSRALASALRHKPENICSV